MISASEAEESSGFFSAKTAMELKRPRGGAGGIRAQLSQPFLTPEERGMLTFCLAKRNERASENGRRDSSLWLLILIDQANGH